MGRSFGTPDVGPEACWSAAIGLAAGSLEGVPKAPSSALGSSSGGVPKSVQDHQINARSVNAGDRHSEYLGVPRSCAAQPRTLTPSPVSPPLRLGDEDLSLEVIAAVAAEGAGSRSAPAPTPGWSVRARWWTRSSAAAMRLRPSTASTPASGPSPRSGSPRIRSRASSRTSCARTQRASARPCPRTASAR